MFFLLRSAACWAKFYRRRQPAKVRTTLPVLESLEDRYVPSTFMVTNTGDGTNSLLWAINQSNTHTGHTNTIDFNLGVNNVIRPSSVLPAITNPVVIDGSTNPGNPTVVLDGANVPGSPNGLTLSAGGSTVRGMQILGFGGDGIYIDSPNNTIEGNSIGVFNGTVSDANGNGNGIVMEGPDAGNNVIGGFLPADANVISDNRGDGVIIRGNNTNNAVVGNFIGTNRNGTAAMGNGNDGIHILDGASLNFIGEEGSSIEGAPSAVGNVISGNGQNGVEISGAGTESNSVLDNRIGTNKAGTAALDNGNTGVVVDQGASDNFIGAGDSTFGNTISGNSITGVGIADSGTDHNLVFGNKIGTTISGDGQLPNEDGVDITNGADDNVISDNVISGNSDAGVGIYTFPFTTSTPLSPTGNQIVGNMIGTTADGSTALANDNYGVLLNTGSTGNTIGGAVAADANVISGNGLDGILIRDDASGNTVEGNFIGVNKADTEALGNQEDGIEIAGGDGNFIGALQSGPAGAVGNVISGNGLYGVEIDAPQSNVGVNGVKLGPPQGNVVQANQIGTDQTGTLDIPNQLDGVIIENGSGNHVGSGSGFGANLIVYNGGDGVLITGQGTSSNVVAGNKIGTNLQGNAAMPNAHNGVEIANGATGNTIGGTTHGTSNLISGNAHNGILIDGQGTAGNFALGNTIGTDFMQDKVLPNGDNGVQIDQAAADNKVGTGQNGADNVISGNGNDGVLIRDNGSNGNSVAGNWIGTNLGATVAMANGNNGVSIADGASDNSVGGPVSADSNVLSGNDTNGVLISATANHNRIENNFIGTNFGATNFGATMVGLGNGGDGIYIGTGATDNFIGAVETVGEKQVIVGNVLSDNKLDGVVINGMGTSGNTLLANQIGTNQAGTQAMPNGLYGVLITEGASDNVVGTGQFGTANVISGNTADGVLIVETGSTGNSVAGNVIGLNLAGTAALPNGNTGVTVANGASDNTIGSSSLADGNLISGNTGSGVEITDANGNKVENNGIGTASDDLTPMPNAYGVFLENGVSNNTIDDNFITDNTHAGVAVVGNNSTGNTISQNSIFDNGGLGIDLANNGVTPNGSGPVGPNHYQNYPVLSPSTTANSIAVTLSGTPGATYTIEFFSSASSTPGQGENYLGSHTVSVGANGTGFFTYTFQSFAMPTATYPYVTATATDVKGDTSEFSTPLQAPLASGGNLTGLSGAPLTGAFATFTSGFKATAADFTATINWGDVPGIARTNLPSDTIGPDGSGFDGTGTHTYAAPGTYRVTVTFQGPDGESMTVRSLVIVF